MSTAPKPKKVRTYAGTIVSGNPPEEWQVVAQSRDDAEKEIKARLGRGEVLQRITHTGFKPVHAEPDDDRPSGVKFVVGEGEKGFVVAEGDAGFDQLRRLDTKGVSAVEEFNARMNE